MSAAELIVPHLPDLRRFARLLSGTSEHGDRLVAAVLEWLIEAPRRLPRKDSARVFLYRSLMTLYNQGRPRPSRHGNEADAAAPSTTTPLQRQALLIVALGELSEPEAAQILDVNVPTVRELVAQGYSDVAAQPGADILIVGDEPLITIDLDQILTGCGHRVVEGVRSATDALRLAKAKRPDLVMITNMRLADGGDGWQLACELQREPAPGIVILTAYPRRFLTGERPEPPFVMGKPYQPAQIVVLTAQVLSFTRARSTV